VFLGVFAVFSARLQALGKHQTFPAPQNSGPGNRSKMASEDRTSELRVVPRCRAPQGHGQIRGDFSTDIYIYIYIHIYITLHHKSEKPGVRAHAKVHLRESDSFSPLLPRFFPLPFALSVFSSRPPALRCRRSGQTLHLCTAAT